MATRPFFDDFDNLKSAKNIRDRAKAQAGIAQSTMEAIRADRETSPVVINLLENGLFRESVDTNSLPGVGINVLNPGESRIWNRLSPATSFLVTNVGGQYRLVELTNL